MTIVGMVLFKEPLTLPKILGLGFAAAALVCFMKG
jgi:multidrug transporter EmrE-like cation transporter